MGFWVKKSACIMRQLYTTLNYGIIIITPMAWLFFSRSNRLFDYPKKYRDNSAKRCLEMIFQAVFVCWKIGEYE
jgi:hypothetical protein